MSDVDLGIVTSGTAGWSTVRKRWEEDLAGYAASLHHLEDYARLAVSLTGRYGARSIGAALAGRAAAWAAIDSGAKVILVTTLQNAPLLPLREGVRYLVYGDCTDAQLARLYNGQDLHFPGTLVSPRVCRLAEHGSYFLCMSEWYRNALREEVSVPEDRLVVLPFYVDTDKWKPLASKPAKPRKQILFVGGDLRRKGADIVYGLAEMDQFRNVDFHLVSPNAQPGPDNLHVHTSLRQESDDLIRLFAECDVFVLPTRADISPIAALEAAACALPAIITRRGGIPEIVVDGVTGSVLSEPTLDSFARELSIYLSDSDLLAQRGHNARRHVERNYSKERHLGILHDVIARAAAEVRQ